MWQHSNDTCHTIIRFAYRSITCNIKSCNVKLFLASYDKTLQISNLTFCKCSYPTQSVIMIILCIYILIVWLHHNIMIVRNIIWTIILCLTVAIVVIFSVTKNCEYINLHYTYTFWKHAILPSIPTEAVWSSLDGWHMVYAMYE